jgi:alcohol dehydrogenase, propanol-preferring
MKAVVVKQAKAPLVVEDRPKPKPKAGEVLIKVKACGVCHSDLIAAQGFMGFERYPLVLGHEVAGVVDEVGPGVTWPKVGDRVGMPWLFSACGHCDQCVAGNEILCPFMTVTGVNQDGGYQEYMIAPALYVAPIPDGLSFEEAGPIMCAGLTVFNGIRRAGYKPGHKVAVIGLGGLGHLAIKYARALGGRVAVLSTSPDKEKEARGLGAEKFINTKTENPAKALMDWDGGADIIVATAPNPDPMTAAIPGLGPDGTLVVLGVGQGMVQASPMDLVGLRRHVMGSPSGGRRDVRDTLRFSVTNNVKPNITKYALEDAAKAHADLHAGKISGRAVLMVG